MQRKESENPFNFAIRKGWKKEICQMILVDFLILNRDRHGANIEIIMDKSGNERMAPLFDHGLSFMFNCSTDEDMELYDVLEDKIVQSFLRGKSTRDNLKLLPEKSFLAGRRLEREDKNYIFRDLDEVLPQKHLDKIWEMIWERWKCYENMFNI